MFAEVFGALKILVGFVAVWSLLLSFVAAPEGAVLLWRRKVEKGTARASLTRLTEVNPPMSDLSSGSTDVKAILTERLGVDVRKVTHHSCTYLGKRGGRLFLNCEPSFDAAFADACKAIEKLPDAAGKLTWATRKNDRGSWELVLVVVLGTKSHAIVQVIRWLDSSATESVLDWLATALIVNADPIGPRASIMPPVGLVGGSDPDTAGNVSFYSFGPALAMPWMIGPVYRSVRGVQQGVGVVQDKSDVLAQEGEFRVASFEPDIFRNGSSGDFKA